MGSSSRALRVAEESCLRIKVCTAGLSSLCSVTSQQRSLHRTLQGPWPDCLKKGASTLKLRADQPSFNQLAEGEEKGVLWQWPKACEVGQQAIQPGADLLSGASHRMLPLLWFGRSSAILGGHL